MIDFIRSAPVGIVDWKLRLRDGTPQWASNGGRLIRIGDAAHTFLPTAGNGAVQGLEDAISLAECLRIGGKEGVAEATKVHNKLRYEPCELNAVFRKLIDDHRFERVSVIQQTGFLNREELHNANIEAMKQDEKNRTIGFFRIGRWIWNHDPEAYVRDNYVACLAHLVDGKPFQNTNLPPGHVYRPWTLESEKRREMAGIKSDLKQNGDWSQ